MQKVEQKKLLDKLIPLKVQQGEVTIKLSAQEFESLKRFLSKEQQNQILVSRRGRRELVMIEEDYSVQEAADIFGVTPQAIYKWINQEKIIVTRSESNSRDIRIPKDQIQFTEAPSKAFLKNRRELFGDDELELDNGENKLCDNSLNVNERQNTSVEEFAVATEMTGYELFTVCESK